ncbi:MAG: protein translocase subunit secF, partial [Humibacillus sp.]|nr:protein translocase subunit secF [Humibacillus sp.]
SLALFIGIAVGAYSSIFIATPLLVDLRRKEKAVVDLDRYVAKHGARAHQAGPISSALPEGAPQPVAVGADRTGAAGEPASMYGQGVDAANRPVHKYAQAGPRNQPKRPPKSKR